jgi:hypothetical protein
VDEESPRERWRGAILPSNVEPAAQTAPEKNPTWRVVQSPWLIGALVITTFNLYAFWWLGRTWSQLKQEDQDAGKRPVWHVLSMVVPIYGYFRFHAHMRTIVQIGATDEARSTLNPLAMTLAWFVITLLSATAARMPEPGWIGLLPGFLSGALIGWAQHGLNTTWRSLPGGAVRGRVHVLHILLLFLGAALLVLAIFALLVAGQ